MKKKLCLLFLASTLSIGSYSIVQASTSADSFQPYYNNNGDLVMPAGGYNGRLVEDEPDLFMDTPINLFSMTYDLNSRGSINTWDSGGTKYITKSDISNGVLQIDSQPSKYNKSGNIEIGLGHYLASDDEVLSPKGLLVTFPANSSATKYIYSPKLTKGKYYGVVNNKSNNPVYGKAYFGDLR